jgi:hypothetical protein
MSPLLLDAKVTRIAEALDRAGIPYAFGGAIALAFYAAPRATEDIDLNVFVPVEQAEICLGALRPLGVVGEPTEHDRERHRTTAYWDHTPIHLFFSYDPFHESCRARTRVVPFGEGRIRVLAAEDITIFKIVYDRPRDRSEVGEVLLCMGERLDLGYIDRWLARLLGHDDARLAGFRRAVAAHRQPPGA